LNNIKKEKNWFKCHNDASETALLQVVDRDARFVMFKFKMDRQSTLEIFVNARRF